MIIAMFGLVPTLIQPAFASEPTTETAEAQRYRLEIRRTTLSAALKDLALQTSLQFARFSDVAPRTIIVGPLSGTYTRSQALDLLLRDTGLTYRFVNGRTVAIVATADPAPASGRHPAPLPAVTKPSPQSAAPAVAPAATGSNTKFQEQKSVSRKKGLLGHIAGFFALCGPLLAAGPAFCQNATADSSSDTLQEVVVTAERRSENLQTTPISVVAISGNDLQAASVTNINDLRSVAPDVTIQSGGSSSTINIRGIGIEPVGLAEAGVAVVRDGIPNVTDGNGTDMPFYDMADIEVLRGPQGTFSGDNSTGGAIIINSQNPNFRGTNGYVTAKVGTYSDNGLQGAVNLPVNDDLAMRLAFNVERRGSFYYDLGSAVNTLDSPYFVPTDPATHCYEQTCASSGTTANKTASDPGNMHNEDMRWGLLWKPTNNFQSLTKIEIDVSTTDGLPTQPNPNTFAPLAPGLPCPRGHGTAPNCVALYTYPGYSGSPFILNSWLLNAKFDNDVTLYTEELRYTLPGGTVVRFVGGDEEIYYDQLSNATGDAIDNQNGIPNVATTKYHVYNGELDFISPTAGPLTWIAGATIGKTKQEFASFTTTTTPPYSAAAPQHTMWVDGEVSAFKSWGVFSQVTWQMTRTLQFQVGARLGWDVEAGKGALEIYQPPPLKNIFGVSADTRDEGQAPEDNWVPSGKIGFNWAPVTGQYFYVFWAHGYKPPLGNLGTAGPTTKEWVNDSELGWKGTLLGGHLLTDVGAYYMQYYQMQESLFNPYDVAAASVDGNIPYATIKGIEASMQSRIGHLGFGISADVNKSALGPAITAKTYAFPPGFGVTNQCPPGVTPNAGNTNCTNYLPYMVSLSGESLPYSPLFQGTATLRYDIPIGEMSLEPRVTYSYVGKQYASLFQIPFYEEPAHGLVDAYLDWTVGPYTTTVYATNLANKLYVTSISATSEYYGAPRQIGLQMNRTF